VPNSQSVRVANGREDLAAMNVRTQFCVFPRTPETGQNAPASSSLGVSRKLHLALFPQGPIATRARVAQVKCNYENEQQK
jgi:hypothetical protein